MENKPFTVTSFEWEKDIAGRLAAAGVKFDADDVILRKLSAFARFLDGNGLTTRKLSANDGTVDHNFVLRSTDITTEGLQVLRKGYEKWILQSKTSEDVRPLEKALRLIRESK